MLTNFNQSPTGWGKWGVKILSCMTKPRFLQLWRAASKSSTGHAVERPDPFQFDSHFDKIGWRVMCSLKFSPAYIAEILWCCNSSLMPRCFLEKFRKWFSYSIYKIFRPSSQCNRFLNQCVCRTKCLWNSLDLTCGSAVERLRQLPEPQCNIRIELGVIL